MKCFQSKALLILTALSVATISSCGKEITSAPNNDIEETQGQGNPDQSFQANGACVSSFQGRLDVCRLYRVENTRSSTISQLQSSCENTALSEDNTWNSTGSCPSVEQLNQSFCEIDLGTYTERYYVYGNIAAQDFRNDCEIVLGGELRQSN